MEVLNKRRCSKPKKKYRIVVENIELAETMRAMGTAARGYITRSVIALAFSDSKFSSIRCVNVYECNRDIKNKDDMVSFSLYLETKDKLSKKIDKIAPKGARSLILAAILFSYYRPASGETTAPLNVVEYAGKYKPDNTPSANPASAEINIVCKAIESPSSAANDVDARPVVVERLNGLRKFEGL